MEKPKSHTITRYDFFEICGYLSGVEDRDMWWPKEDRPEYYDRYDNEHQRSRWVREWIWGELFEWFSDDKHLHLSVLKDCLSEEYNRLWDPEGKLNRFCQMLSKHYDLGEDAYLYADY